MEQILRSVAIGVTVSVISYALIRQMQKRNWI